MHIDLTSSQVSVLKDILVKINELYEFDPDLDCFTDIDNNWLLTFTPEQFVDILTISFKLP
ncbi:hypothetical protein ES703_55255 [subsurface metagenome]